MLKPLYRITEVGTYQQTIYSKYYKEKLLITTSIFNLYFLIIRGVFKFKKYNPTKFNKVYIFKLRIVNKIKGKAINALFKKLRLII